MRETGRGAGSGLPTAPPTLRIDRWLWAARFFKTRSSAAAAVSGGRVHLNGQRTKPAKAVRAGDRLDVRRGDNRWEITVLATAERRGPASEARTALRGAPGERRAPGARARGEARAPPRGRRRRRTTHQARPPDARSTHRRLIRRPRAPPSVHPAAAVRCAVPARSPEAPVRGRGSLSRPAAPRRGP